MNPPKHILPLIVFAQFAGTSLWFAGNAVVGDLQTALGLPGDTTGNLTSAVQFGFIVGTLVFAILSIADRFSPVRVFLISAVLGAIFNLAVGHLAEGIWSLLSLRFLTGFFLAGIYPVGMKISADWYNRGLGKALGYLVGALVLGTAFPHLLRAIGTDWPWQNILTGTSILAVFGAVMLFLFVGDGPYRQPAAQFNWGAIPQIFRYPRFRSSALGYFGHMWELYAMWAFVPAILLYYSEINGGGIDVSLWSFLIIGAGGLGCIFGGYISVDKGSRWVASAMLVLSGICCLISPIYFGMPKFLFLFMLFVWGFSVVGDSPQFSTIVAIEAPKEYIGTALTIVNCIGFALTIFSIQLLDFLQSKMGAEWIYLALLPGPVTGLLFFRRGNKAD